MNTTTSPAEIDTIRQIAATIRQQIGVGSLMSLGAHAFRHGKVAPVREADALPSLIFNATILPFTASGARGSAERTMKVVVSLNSRDLYDVLVTYNRRGDRYGTQPPVVHYEADDVDAESLAALMLALDYDGDTAVNPRLA